MESFGIRLRVANFWINSLIQFFFFIEDRRDRAVYCSSSMGNWFVESLITEIAFVRHGTV